MEGKKLSFKEYALAVEEAAGIAYGEADVQVHEVVKNNGKRCEALTLQQEGENVMPVLYLDSFYQEYLEHGFVESVNALLEVYEGNRCRGYVDFGFFNMYENVKSRIFPRLVNYGRNVELLKGCPHVRFLDLAVMFQYVFVKDGECCCITVQNNYMEKWGKTVQEVYADAMRCLGKNLYRNPLFDEITLLSESMGACMELDGTADGMYGLQVFSNQMRFYGASAMLDTDALERAAVEMGCDRVYILPSSVHEVLLLGDGAEVEAPRLRGVVGEVNQSGAVREEDFLSDNVYIYKRSTGKVHMA